MSLSLIFLNEGTHCTGKTGKMAKKQIPVRENTGNLEILPKHMEFGLLKCNFHDSKGKRHFDICRKNYYLDESAKSVLGM